MQCTYKIILGGLRKYICYKENIVMWNTVMWNIVIGGSYCITGTIEREGREGVL
jgi:hypothetical protein